MSTIEDLPVGAVVCRPGGYVVGTVTRHEPSGGVRVEYMNHSGEAIWRPYELEPASEADTPTLW